MTLAPEHEEEDLAALIDAEVRAVERRVRVLRRLAAQALAKAAKNRESEEDIREDDRGSTDRD